MYLSSLKNKNVLITGCNKGIGKATLEGFAKYGANIFACVRSNSSEFKKFISTLKKKYKVKIYVIKLDLLKKSSISNCVNEIYKINKNIDTLVNNAGMLFNSLFQMTSEKQLQEMFQVNYFSQVYLTQIISRGMTKNKTGNIIFVSSTSGINGDYGRFAYSSSKAAILSTVKTLSKELSNYNIRVNAVSPGLTETDLMLSNTKEDIIKSEIEKISLKRIASTNEIADIILFLASEKSSYINGQNIVADGGNL
jgi:3-oxoacyl-[acyl-carrier protein] reductase|tara:strand:- start:3496 stop:4251 length:756 start_codon:yes stop_codon:yes gene_type:complete